MARDRAEYMKVWREKRIITGIEKEYRKTMTYRYNRYKRDAITREIDFDLSKEEFEIFWNKPCSYCGSEIETIGLDRVNSRLGYSVDNIVSCCKSCNYMKLADDVDIWVAKMKSILKHMGEI